MLVDCMFSQLYQSLIESQRCCLDCSNFNQFETTTRADVFTKRFSLSCISDVNFLMTFWHFFHNGFFISVLSLFWISSKKSYCKLFKLLLKVWFNFAEVHKFNFRCFIKYWNGQYTVATWSVEKVQLFPCHMWHTVKTGIKRCLFPSAVIFTYNIHYTLPSVFFFYYQIRFRRFWEVTVLWANCC